MGYADHISLAIGRARTRKPPAQSPAIKPRAHIHRIPMEHRALFCLEASRLDLRGYWLSRVRATYVEDPAGLGERLRQARKLEGLTQRSLAFAGCSSGYISRIEAGERVPSLQILRELARRIGVSESYLRTGREATLAGSSALLDAEIALRLGDLDTARTLYDQVVEESTSDTVRSEALEGLGNIATQLGEFQEAIELLEQALGLAGTRLDERSGLSESLGRAYATSGELAPAIALFRDCLRRFESNPLQYIRFACLLSYALTDTGEFGEAERVVAKALEVGREVQDPYARSRLYWSQSRLLLEGGRSDLAERYAVKTLETLRVTEDVYALGHAYQTLANVYLDLGRAQEASQTLTEGWPLISASATPLELAHYNIDQARALAVLGQEQQATELAEAALEELGDALPVGAGRAYLLLAEIFKKVGDRARARELFTVGLDLLETHGPNRYLITGYKGLAALLKEDGRVQEALDVFERAVNVQERLGAPSI